MKTVILLSIAASLNACATNAVMEKARGESFSDKPKPILWALMPLAVPFDIITFPIQLVVLGATLD